MPIKNIPTLSKGVARLKIRSSYKLSLDEITFINGPLSSNLEIKVIRILREIPIEI
jgi:hypothetical protein